jgi:hypothetical protein
VVKEKMRGKEREEVSTRRNSEHWSLSRKSFGATPKLGILEVGSRNQSMSSTPNKPGMGKAKFGGLAAVLQQRLRGLKD